MNVGGQVRAYANTCPHQAGPLDEGDFDGETLVCEVRADVQFSRLDQEGHHHGGPGGSGAGVRQAARFREQMHPLAPQHRGQHRRISGLGGGHHLEEEIVPVATGGDARLTQPAVELCPAGLGDLVDQPVRLSAPATSTHRTPARSSACWPRCAGRTR